MSNNNNYTTNHAIMFFFLLSVLLVYSHAFFSSSPSKPSKSKPRNSSSSCNCPTSDPPINLFLPFFSGMFFTLLCILTISFPTLFTAPIKSAVRRFKSNRNSPPPPPPIVRYHSSAVTEGGISASLLNTLPIFAYSSEKRHNFGNDAGLCAICLSKFLNEQTLRWLPDCDHLFHRGCIDTWLESNKTCPCCRANVEREAKLIENGENSGSPEIGSSFRRFSGEEGGRRLEDRRRNGCERSVVSGLIRVLMGRRRNHDNRLRHR